MKKDCEFATCEYCDQQMAPGNGCGMKFICIEDKLYERIKAGDDLDFLPDMDKDEVCHDCNVKAGQYHHLGCDAERCPICYDQLFMCDCFADENKVYLAK